MCGEGAVGCGGAHWNCNDNAVCSLRRRSIVSRRYFGSSLYDGFQRRGILFDRETCSIVQHIAMTKRKRTSEIDERIVATMMIMIMTIMACCFLFSAKTKKNVKPLSRHAVLGAETVCDSATTDEVGHDIGMLWRQQRQHTVISLRGNNDYFVQGGFISTCCVVSV
jgi:hypothetical protein